MTLTATPYRKGFFTRRIGPLQRQLRQGEYGLFRFSPMFESNFVQISKQGGPIEIHNQEQIVTVAITSTSPVLLIPNVLLLARPITVPEEAPPKHRNRFHHHPPVKYELTRLFPLRFVKITVHNAERQQLRFKLANGRTFYLQLCSDSERQEDLFEAWVRIVQLLRPPSESSLGEKKEKQKKPIMQKKFLGLQSAAKQSKSPTSQCITATKNSWKIHDATKRTKTQQKEAKQKEAKQKEAKKKEAKQKEAKQKEAKQKEAKQKEAKQKEAKKGHKPPLPSEAKQKEAKSQATTPHPKTGIMKGHDLPPGVEKGQVVKNQEGIKTETKATLKQRILPSEKKEDIPSHKSPAIEKTEVPPCEGSPTGEQTEAIPSDKNPDIEKTEAILSQKSPDTEKREALLSHRSPDTQRSSSRHRRKSDRKRAGASRSRSGHRGPTRKPSKIAALFRACTGGKREKDKQSTRSRSKGKKH